MPPRRPQVEKLHRQRLKAQTPESSYNGAGEAEVVPGFQLSVVLRKWVVEWLRERPYRNENTNGATVMQFHGPHDYLSEQTGLHVRRVSGIINGEFFVVPLTQADALLQAIERPDLLGAGEIQVVVNPNWSLEKWMDYMAERGCI
jgi:hypothetical protein